MAVLTADEKGVLGSHGDDGGELDGKGEVGSALEISAKGGNQNRTRGGGEQIEEREERAKDCGEAVGYCYLAQNWS